MKIRYWLGIGVVALALTACGQADSTPTSTPAAEIETVAPTAFIDEAGTDEAETATETAIETKARTETEPVTTDINTDTKKATVAPPATSTSASTTIFLPPEPAPRGAEAEFSTDFDIHSIPYSEILSGGPPKDGIPAIDNPSFVSVSEADEWIGPAEPVALLQVGDEARAYPLQILIWHEIVNDAVADVPVTVTFCPLCNTVIAFDRRFDDKVLDFGTTGRLRFSNLVMYDRQTESWWQQATGDAIAGELTGSQLDFLPAQLISWEDFKTTYPDSQVLSRDTGFNRSYGQNPYAGYDNVNQSPFLYIGPETPGQLLPMARIITVDLNGEAVAYPYDTLEETPVINDTVGDTPITVFWKSGTASALDESNIATSRDVGAANTFSRELNGQTLTFQSNGDKIIDEQTGSEWDILGQAISGELAGSQLEPVVNVNHFWFSWAAFRPDTRIYES